MLALLLALALLGNPVPPAIPDGAVGTWLLYDGATISQTLTISADGTTSGTYVRLDGSGTYGDGVWIGNVEERCGRRGVCGWYWHGGRHWLRLRFDSAYTWMTIDIHGYPQTYVKRS